MSGSAKRASAPWSVPVLVGQIPPTGLHKVIAPNAQEAQRIADLGELLHVSDIKADLELMPMRGDRIRVTGRVTGTVGQTCVVTLDSIDVPVDEEIALEFAPAELIRALSASADDAGYEDDAAERPDPPEPIENDAIDIGQVATDAIYLGLDPYPRKPGAVFEQPDAGNSEDEHPFAALKALKPRE